MPSLYCFSTLSLNSSSLTSSAVAASALTLITAAIASVAQDRGTLGATVEQLQAAATVDTDQSQNLTSASSNITSADISTVVANDTKYSILEQTGISALAQANQQAQNVLKLIHEHGEDIRSWASSCALLSYPCNSHYIADLLSRAKGANGRRCSSKVASDSRLRSHSATSSEASDDRSDGNRSIASDNYRSPNNRVSAEDNLLKRVG